MFVPGVRGAAGGHRWPTRPAPRRVTTGPSPGVGGGPRASWCCRKAPWDARVAEARCLSAGVPLSKAGVVRPDGSAK
eukprot:3636717-Lingulodinium_polyedra.AAC.1